MTAEVRPALIPGASSNGAFSIERLASRTPSQRNKDVEKGDVPAKGGEVTMGAPLAPGASIHGGEQLQRQMSSRHSELRPSACGRNEDGKR